MRVPGFCAETAIGKASRTYRSHHISSDVCSRTVTPSQLLDGNDSSVGTDEAELVATIEDVMADVMDELTRHTEYIGDQDYALVSQNPSSCVRHLQESTAA
jgi:hypothetical protein